MEIVSEHQNFFIGETGIETASTRLMKQTMSGKIFPFKIKNWEKIIKESLELMHDNNFIPYCSLIIGLPGENSEDVIKTLNLIDDLKTLRFILLPSGFTPLGMYTDLDAKKSSFNSLDPLNKELVVKCAVHNSRWVYSLAKMILDKDLLYRFLSGIWYAQTYLKNITSYNKTHYVFSISRQSVFSGS
jgi:radical SAM superfamily enzyme YgiQ (UPF0313 family)